MCLNCHSPNSESTIKDISNVKIEKCTTILTMYYRGHSGSSECLRIPSLVIIIFRVIQRLIHLKIEKPEKTVKLPVFNSGTKNSISSLATKKNRPIHMNKSDDFELRSEKPYSLPIQQEQAFSIQESLPPTHKLCNI